MDWGDGRAEDVFSVAADAPRQVTAEHIFADNGTYTVDIRVTDKDQGLFMTTAEVVVSNVDPTLTVLGDQVALKDVPFSFVDIGSFVDPVSTTH